MSSTRNPNLSELAMLQLEAAKLRRSEDSPEPGKHSGTAGESIIHGQENAAEYSHEDQNLNPDFGPEKAIHEWKEHLAALATELEAAALAHPRLALLVAFGFGVVAGQLLSRRQD